MSLTLLSPAAGEPISLQDLKDHLRITHNDEDVAINGYLVAAVRAIEARASLAMLTQGWRFALDCVPEVTVFLPIAPAVSIDAVMIIDRDGVPQPAAPETYEFAAGSPGRLRRAAPWPRPGVGVAGVQIDFTAGYADAASVPEPLKQAVQILAAHFYERREALSETRLYGVPQSIDALIAPFKQVQL